MKLSLTTTFGVLALGLAALATTPASAGDAWSHTRSGVGPYGGEWYANSKGHCDDDHCSSHQKVVGPEGKKLERSGHTSCSGDTCSYSATITGPDGGTTSRKATWSR